MDRRFVIVGLFSLYCLAFGSLRFFLVGDHWGFLSHNLWLGWIPVIVAGIVKWKKPAGWLLGGLWFAWFIFLPNSPYIVTDLVHMRGKSTLPWFDLLVLFHYALAGLLAGSLSLDWMEDAVEAVWGKLTGVGLTAFAIVASGFGMTMGRDFRLGSKQMFTEPLEVFTKTLSGFEGGENIIKSLIYAATFGVAYVLYRTLSRPPAKP